MTNQIQARRNARGWTQATFAEKVGVSRQTINALESGKTEPSLGLAMRIAWLFDTTIEGVFIADLEERMTVIEAAWSYTDRRATALNEIHVLHEMGREGWELMSFGAGFLRFRRPEDAALRVGWDYRRLSGTMSFAKRGELEDDGWTYCGSWMSMFHYFKRRASG